MPNPPTKRPKARATSTASCIFTPYTGTKGTTSTANHEWDSTGEYTVTLTVTDNDGRTAEATVTVKVISLLDAIDALIALKESYGCDHGIEKSLDVKLGHARADIVNASYSDAKSHLESFINEVEAQSGKKLTVAQADALIACAQRIIDNMPT